jgi:hypothetical protein
MSFQLIKSWRSKDARIKMIKIKTFVCKELPVSEIHFYFLHKSHPRAPHFISLPDSTFALTKRSNFQSPIIPHLVPKMAKPKKGAVPMKSSSSNQDQSSYISGLTIGIQNLQVDTPSFVLPHHPKPRDQILGEPAHQPKSQKKREKQKHRKKQKRDIAVEFNDYFGDASKLVNWQRLCTDVGIEEKPSSLTACRNVSSLSNIYRFH